MKRAVAVLGSDLMFLLTTLLGGSRTRMLVLTVVLMSRLVTASQFSSMMPSFTQALNGNETEEERLFRHLFKNYKERRLVQPVIDRSKPIRVTLDTHLLGLAKVNEKEQSIKTHLWMREEWNNPFLTWSPAQFDDIKEINVPANMLWVPDIILYNNADDRDEGISLFNTKVTVKYDGNNTWRAPAIYNSMCVLDVKYFPFDEQTCELVFASWTHGINHLDLIVVSNEVSRSPKDTKFFQENEEWRVLFAKIVRQEVAFDWADFPIAEVTISIRIQRRTYYYVMNLILPCTLIACTIFLEFILPAESGERVGLGITILLSMAVFQELTSEKLPSSSEHFPLLAMYYSVSIMEIGTALAATCIILNIYHRKTEMPKWFRRLVLVWLAPLVKCKPRCTSREIMETQHEEAMMNMLTFKASDVRRNDLYEFDRDSTEFDMDLMETVAPSGQHAPNGSVACNNMQQRHPMRRCQEEGNPSQEPLQHDPMSTHRLQLSERLNEDIRRKEWQDAARVLDRVLLVASIVIGSVSAMAIFLQSPRIRGFFVL